MENINQNDLILFDTRCWTRVVEGLKYTFKGWVREVVEDVISEKICSVNLEDKRITAKELCQRWNIGKSTLYNWERDGKISSLPLGGRKKVYSMKDVLNAEADGLIKTAC